MPDEIPLGLQPWSSFDKEMSPEEITLFSESLTTSFLLLLEKLSPHERVVFILSETLGYTFKEVGKLLNKTPESCRKIAERARSALKDDSARFPTPSKESEKILAKFFDHAKSGDVQKMIDLLSPKSELWGDGGGHVKAAGHLSHRSDIIDFFKGLIASGIYQSDSYKIETHTVNSRPGVTISKKLNNGFWCFDTILSFELRDNLIIRIYAQRNPDKLAYLIQHR